VSDYTDVQAQAVFAGAHPGADRYWGYERAEHWGTLRTASGATLVPSLQGDYTDFYDKLAAAIQNGTPGPVPAREALETLLVLDAGRISAAEHRTVEVARTPRTQVAP
jgi:predicted dehydrogenase